MSDPQAIDLLTKIAERTLVAADALTVGKEGVKFDGDVIARLRSIESKQDSVLAALSAEPERAESEPETPAEPDASKEAIKAAVTAIRAAADAIEAQL